MNGFIYVMTNPTVPGLAKVGMTTRDPATRQNELSQATGVASPFILVYSQPVKNCRAAEAWVHETLELAGFRHSASREFFNAPLHDVVRIVAQATEVGAAEAELAEVTIDQNELDYLSGEALKATGDKYFLGRGVIKNPQTALRYYKLALKAQQWEALVSASSILRGEHGLKEDPESELELINCAVDAGQWRFLSMAASLFARQGQFEVESAQGAWITYFSKVLPLVQELEKEDSDDSCEKARLLRKDAANVALEALEYAVEDKFDTSERGWWKVFYTLNDQIQEEIEEKYSAMSSELFDQRRAALMFQLVSAGVRYLSEMQGPVVSRASS